MPLRTPRRRISPRTKLRCRAIKEFFKKTIGTLSQTDNRTNSSIIVSVSDLKSKIDIIEQQLDRVSKHCRDISCLDHDLGRGESSTTQNNVQNNNVTNENKDVQTKIIYKTPQDEYDKSDESKSISKFKWEKKKSMNSIRKSPKRNSEYEDRPINTRKYYNGQVKKVKDYSYLKIRPERGEDVNDNLREVSSSVSLQSPRNRYHLDEPSYSGYHHESKYHTKETIDKMVLKGRGEREESRREFSPKRNPEHRKSRKKKHRYPELDEEFIADIIRRQYKPVKLFGRKVSDFSQFSAPVCRDQEYSFRDDVEEGSQLCSCCFEGQRKISHRPCRKYDVSDMRSICDARLYSSKKHRRYKQAYINDYNDSNLYDLVPVKEKSSPKSRRKFMEENFQYGRNKEVLPSPRTHRPRLNLKAQHYDFDDIIERRHESPPMRSNVHRDAEETTISNSNFSDHHLQHHQRQIHIKEHSKPTRPQDGATISSLQYSAICNEQNINNETLNTQLTGSSADKTDRALCEIKDILQSFLKEIKKDSIHSHNSEVSSKTLKQPEVQVNEKNKSNTTPNDVQSSFNNFSGFAQCQSPSFMPPFANPCCYPLLPICPINCGPNGYVVPSPSYTCASCAINSKEAACRNNSTNANTNQLGNSKRDETQELIKEIYKCVAQTSHNPGAKDMSNRTPRVLEKKVLTSRSVGSSKASKHDAMVETPKMKCYSKSCEAIGSRITTDTNSTNPTYSDTVIEKLSLGVSRSSSDSEIDKISEKKHKFSNVLRRIGLFKRKKKDAIEEVSESDSTVEVDVKPKSKPPFRQHIMNYNVHGQEYFHPPLEHHCCHTLNTPHRHTCGEEFVAQRYDVCKHGHHPQDHSTPQYYPHQAAPPCRNHDHDHYHNMPQAPQVPLCLKEIEVKSIGTQSERKLSIFPRFKKKIQSSRPQTLQQNIIPTQTPKETNILFNWEKLKEKARQNANSNTDPLKFSLKTQKQLAMGDMKMRNQLLKKLFYKRNPFSPRNLIVRTLLGKDISSFGEPPRMYKPRMFI